MGCQHSKPTVTPLQADPSVTTTSSTSTATSTALSTNTTTATTPTNEKNHDSSTVTPTSPTATTGKHLPNVPTHPVSKAADLRYIMMKNGLAPIRIRRTLTKEDKIYEITDQLIAKGKEGEVYKAILRNLSTPDNTVYYNEKEFIACKILPRTIFSDNDQLIQDFIKINYTAASQRFGPKVYDIMEYEDENIYLFTELLSGDMKKWITLQILVPDDDNLEGSTAMVPVNFNMLLPDIQSIVAPIHEKMYHNRITLGDDHMDNYMYNSSNNGWYRIDFTQCRFHATNNDNNDDTDSDEEIERMAQYQVFKVINPFNNETKKLYQLCKHLK